MLYRFPEVEVDQGITKYQQLSTVPVGEKAEILVVRPGGYGDVLFCTATLRALKEMHPSARIVFACLKPYADALGNNPDVDEVVPYPVPVEFWNRATHHLWLENVIEDGPETITTHAVDLIAAAAGVELVDKTMVYVNSDVETAWAKERFPRIDKPRVGIQVQASALNRTYPFEALEKVAANLVVAGCEVFLFGNPGSLESDDRYVNLSALNLTFRQSGAVVETCDVMITPDSSLCHVAAALNIPTVALFGPFPSRLRTAYQPSVYAIDGYAPCSPCHHHEGSGQPWPKDCPGWKTNKCAALANIDPARIVKKTLALVAVKQGGLVSA